MKYENERKAHESKYNYHPRTRSNRLLVFQKNNEQLDKVSIDKIEDAWITKQMENNIKAFKLKAPNLLIEPTKKLILKLLSLYLYLFYFF